jgi:PAS domain S-box-containing protein
MLENIAQSLRFRLPSVARADRATPSPRWTRADVGALIFFAISYWLSVKASEHLYGSLRVPSPFWLPDSILLCALLLWRREAWWALAVVALPVRLLAGAQDGTPQWFIVTSMLNDVSKAFFSAWLLQRLIRRPIQLNTLREFLIFVCVAVGLSPLLSALAGAATRGALGNPVLDATYRWFLGDALAQVVVTPAILYWFRGNYRHAGARLRELALVCGGMVLLASYVFLVYEGPLVPMLLYAPVPLLAWAALRLRPFGTANAIAIVASIAVLSVVKGIGVFPGSSPDQSVESIQLFLLVLSVSFLSIAVLAAEQQKQVEEFRTLLDAAPITILMTDDPESRHIIANRTGYDALRIPPGTNIAELAADGADGPFRVVRDGVDVPTQEMPLQRAALHGVPVLGHTSTLLFPDGTERHMIGNATPLVGADGRPRGAVGAFLDITELRRAEDALKESEERFRLLADTAPVLIWTSGTDKLCTFTNKAWLDFTGRSMAQELGTGWSFSIHPDDRDRAIATYEEAFDRRTSCEMEYRIRRHDNTYRWIAVYGVPRFESSGAFCGYIGSCLDVTDRRSVEATLRELSGRLISAQESERVRIARELHDDLGQQVALLQMSIDRFEAGLSNLSDDAVQQLRAISRGTERMASGIHKTAHRLHPFKLEVVGLVTALNGLCREFSEQHELSVQFVQHDMPPVLSQDVSLCLFRIAQEALHNVVKHAKVSKATVELSGRNGDIELSVADAGAGFDVDSAAAKGGLGLVSMRERLRLVGGRLSIEALHRQGTRISACVPASVRHGADSGEGAARVG